MVRTAWRQWPQAEWSWVGITTMGLAVLFFSFSLDLTSEAHPSTSCSEMVLSATSDFHSRLTADRTAPIFFKSLPRRILHEVSGVHVGGAFRASVRAGSGATWSTNEGLRCAWWSPGNSPRA